MKAISRVRCLLVDDDPQIRSLLSDYLGNFELDVTLAADGAAMRQALQDAPFQVLLLDLMLPDADGLQLCQWVRQHHAALYVIVLTAQGDPLSRVLGLELGADDYMAKPFEPRELVARIKAGLRRGQPAPADAPAVVRFSRWTFDRLRRELVAEDGTLLALSSAEFRLLSTFVAHPGKVLSRERLLQLSRAPGVVVSDRSIDLAVSRLRSKLDGPGTSRPLIRTLRGEGYLFDATPSP